MSYVSCRKFFSRPASPNRGEQAGFTLLELLVVIAILGTLLWALIITLNPITQLSKADDVKRKQEIAQITNMLDVYYNDHSCYPTSIPFGGEWSEGDTVYMTKVPQNPSCGGDLTKCYRYTTSGTCPQWGVVFAKLSLPQEETVTAASCPLSAMTGCVPQDYSSSWSCELSGSVDCPYLQTYSLSTPPDMGPTPTPTSPLLPTPTPDPCPEEQRNYSCTGAPQSCNLVPQGTGTYCTSACGGVC